MCVIRRFLHTFTFFNKASMSILCQMGSVSMVSEAVQTNQKKALECSILGQDGGLEAYARNNIIAAPFLNPHIMPDTVLSTLCV